MNWNWCYKLLAYLHAIQGMAFLFLFHLLTSFQSIRLIVKKRLEKEGYDGAIADSSMLQWEAFESMKLKRYFELTKSAKLGKAAPNISLMDLNGRRVHLLDYMVQGRPLLQKFNSIVAEHKKFVDFLLVYIAEAHPEDGWFVLGSKFRVKQHQNELDRLTAARNLVEKLDVKGSVAIDLMSNDAAKTYGSMIDRLFILYNGMVYFEGGPGPENYSLEELESKLKNFGSS